MSHEGIRFISEQEAQRLAQETAHDLPREATEPARVRVQKTTGTGMEIDWKDGHQSTGLSAGCVMLALVPLAMKSAELPGVSRVSRSHSRRHCCRCIRRRRGRSLFRPLAATRSASTGMMATRAGSTPGITFAAIALCAAVPA